MELIGTETRAVLAAHHPEAAGEIANVEQALADAPLDPELLRLCQQYFAAALNGKAFARPAPGTRDAACIAFCEQFMVSVANVSDEQVNGLLSHCSGDEVYNLASAIYLIEMSKRLELTLARVLS